MPSLCALLGNVEITVSPGEITSSELCQVSACTLLNARYNRLKRSSSLAEHLLILSNQIIHRDQITLKDMNSLLGLVSQEFLKSFLGFFL